MNFCWLFAATAVNAIRKVSPACSTPRPVRTSHFIDTWSKANPWKEFSAMLLSSIQVGLNVGSIVGSKIARNVVSAPPSFACAARLFWTSAGSLTYLVFLSARRSFWPGAAAVGRA